MHNALAPSGIRVRDDDEDEAFVSFADFLTMMPYFLEIHEGTLQVIMQYFWGFPWFIISMGLDQQGTKLRDLERGEHFSTNSGNITLCHSLTHIYD